MVLINRMVLLQNGLKKVGKSKFAKKVKGKFNKFKESKVGH